jgi:putative MATE family efflux protein
MSEVDKNNPAQLMFSGPVGSLLIRLALPIYASTMFWVIYTLTDIYWISRIDPEDPAIVGGVSLIIPIYMLAFALSNGLLIGIKSLVARAVGAENEELLNRVASAGLALAACAAVVFLVVGYTYSEEITRSLGAQGDLFEHAHIFLLYILPATALIFSFSALSGIAQGEGQMKHVMHAMGVGVGLNLLLDPLFIFILDLGVLGAALATCISQAISLAYLVFVFIQGGMRVPLNINIFQARLETISKILKTGLPQGFAEVLVALYLFVVNWIVVSIDPSAMTAFGLCARVDQLLLLSIAAISSAVLTAAAQNAGRGNLERINQITKMAIMYGGVIVLAQALPLMFFSPWVYSILSNSDIVINYSVNQTRIINLFYVFAIPTLVYHSFFLAIGHPWPAVKIQLVKMFAVSLPLMLLLTHVLELNMYGVWIGIATGEASAAAIAYIWGTAYYKRLKRGLVSIDVA